MGNKILFADDDALVSRIYRDKLAEEGFDVMVAEDGIVAMRLLVEFKPDVVVLDLLMPKMTGADVLKFIRQHPELIHTRVIVFSNSFLSALVEEVGSVGVEETLPKSTATPRLLIERIRKVLSNQPNQPVYIDPPPPDNKPIPFLRPSGLSILKPEPVVEPKVENKTKDDLFLTRVQAEFVEHLPGVVADIRKFCGQLVNATDTTTELARVEDLSRKVGFLTQMSTMAGNQPLAQLASALELLLFHLHEKHVAVDDSCRHTVAETVAFLTAQFETLGIVGMEEPPQACVLVVDDDAVSNRGILHALVHANVRASSETNALSALEWLRNNNCDLILLDIDLPGITGLELCEQIREQPLHQRTPVIFVTSYNDLKTRSQAIMSGGNDFICKPILPIELTVKVITEVLKGRLARAN